MFAVIAAAAAFAATAAQSAPSGKARFTPAEVKKATGRHQVVSIYAVPKKLPKRYLLAFLNPGHTVPFFQDWSDAMKAAAKFYGVRFIETDLELKFENTVSSYETIAGRHPDVVGTLTTAGTALKARTDKAKIPIVPMEIAIPGVPYFLGIPNAKAGTLSGKYIAPLATKRLTSGWKGKNVVFVGLGSDNGEVNKRVTAALAELRKTITIDDSNVVMIPCNGQADPCQTALTDTLTARPNDALVIVAMNDEAGVGALQAVKSQRRTSDALLVTQGADKAGRDMLRSDTSGVMVGALDYNPWAEGWSWVEAAIAVTQHEKFRPYNVNRFVTRQNVDVLYPGES